MAARTLIETYRALKETPIWKLLAGQNAPVTVGLLENLLYEGERQLPASVFIDRLALELAELEAADRSADRESRRESRESREGPRELAKLYAARWVKEGYIVCRLPAGVAEEVYELTSAGLDVIRFLTRYRMRRSGPTETRLDMVTHALIKLANDSDADPEARIARLEAEKARIDAEIAAVREGRAEVLATDSALTRTNDILDLFYELQTDFRRVREEFERLNRNFRAEILRSDAPRGDMLERFFEGYDAIRDSDAGRAFEGFYRLLTDPRATDELQNAIDRIRTQPFFEKLGDRDKELLTSLQTDLLERARDTRSVMSALARSLREFVERHEYREEKRLDRLIREADAAARDAAHAVSPGHAVHTLEFTSAYVTSLSTLELYDPELSRLSTPIETAKAPVADLRALAARLRDSDIDYAGLKRAVRRALAEHETVTVGEVLALLGEPRTDDTDDTDEENRTDKHSAPTVRRGLALLVGLLTLAARYGEPVRDPKAEFLEELAARRATATSTVAAATDDEGKTNKASEKAPSATASDELASFRLYHFETTGDAQDPADHVFLNEPEDGTDAKATQDAADAADTSETDRVAAEDVAPESTPDRDANLTPEAFFPLVPSADLEHVTWTTRTGETREATVPTFRFTGASLEKMRRSRGLR